MYALQHGNLVTWGCQLSLVGRAVPYHVVSWAKSGFVGNGLRLWALWSRYEIMPRVGTKTVEDEDQDGDECGARGEDYTTCMTVSTEKWCTVDRSRADVTDKFRAVRHTVDSADDSAAFV